MERHCKIHLVHVPETRMIAQGTDALSRGTLDEVVMVGREMINFIPLNRCALQVHPQLRTWLDMWLPVGAVYLSPEYWYGKGHNLKGGSVSEEGVWVPHNSPRNFIWHPPPTSSNGSSGRA
eukprot:14264841-Ditylum_brightwellii.AAC.1